MSSLRNPLSNLVSGYGLARVMGTSLPEENGRCDDGNEEERAEEETNLVSAVAFHL